MPSKWWWAAMLDNDPPPTSQDNRGCLARSCGCTILAAIPIGAGLTMMTFGAMGPSGTFSWNFNNPLLVMGTILAGGVGFLWLIFGVFPYLPPRIQLPLPIIFAIGVGLLIVPHPLWRDPLFVMGTILAGGVGFLWLIAVLLRWPPRIQLPLIVIFAIAMCGFGGYALFTSQPLPLHIVTHSSPSPSGR